MMVALDHDSGNLLSLNSPCSISLFAVTMAFGYILGSPEVG
jgi:hypothetical protein